MGLCGFRQTDNPDFPTLSAPLLKTDSNLLIEHPLLNIENIDMTSRNYSTFNFAAYNPGTTYKAGDRVKDVNIVYESLVSGNTGNTPAGSPAQWGVVNLLSLYLEDVMRSSIDQVVERVFDEKRMRREAKTLIQSVRAMDGSGYIHNLILNEGNLCGWEITLQHRQNLIAIIEQIGVQISQPQAELKLYLYHSSQLNGPIQTITINPSGGSSFSWHRPTTRVALHHLTDQYNAGGAFYLMYDQNDLVGQMIRNQYNIGTAPCTCSPGAYRNWQKLTPYVSLRSVYVPMVDRPINGDLLPDPEMMFDLTKVKAGDDNNFGLNIDVTVQCDLTQFLIRQRDIFGPAIRDMAIAKMLDNMINSTRQNILDERTKQLARYALQDRRTGGGGILEDVARKIKTTDFEVSALDNVCMPCNNKAGVRHTTIGLQW